MGKKKSGRGRSNAGEAEATSFVLKVPMHCRCDGCGDKIRDAVRDLTLRCDGILSLDRSALATSGELAVVATADPERLRRRLRKATGKDVGLVFPKPAPVDGGKDAAAAATVQALLAGLQLQQHPVAVHALHGHPLPAAGAWNALHHGGYAFPWVVQQLQAPPEPYLPSYPAAAYPTAGSWDVYPHDGVGGAYGGGWLGY